jgi:hypothetical protein
VSLIFSHSGGSRALWSRRLLGLPSITLEPPPPPLRRKLDQQGSFEETRSQETMPNQHPEEPTISDLGVESLGPPETPTTDLSVPIIIQIYPYGRQTVSHATMETNVATSYGNYSIPTMVVTTGGVPPPNPPSVGLSHHGLDCLYLEQWYDPIFGRWPLLLSHRVRQALHSHTGCLAQVQALYYPTPLCKL